MSGYPRTPSSIDLIIPPAPVNAGLYEQLCVISSLTHRRVSAGISGNLMLFSMITYPFKLLRNPPFPTSLSSLQSSFTRHSVPISNILSRTFLRFATETERILTHLVQPRTTQTPSHMYHKLPSSTTSRLRRIAFHTAMLFASLHDSFLLFHPLPLALQHFNRPLFSQPFFYSSQIQHEIYPPALSLMCFI